MEELRERLIGFARELAACQWHTSPSYETTTEDQIKMAVEGAKSEIGEALLRALGADPSVEGEL